MLDLVIFQLENYQMPAVEQDVLYLAINSYFEDRQHDLQGMRDVATVVLNRYNDPKGRWVINGERDIEAIITQPSNDPKRPWRCKFSWTCDSIPDIIDDEKSFSMALQAAQEAIDLVEDGYYQPAFYYYKCSVHLNQGWMSRIKFLWQTGVHCFYGDKE